MSAWQHMSLLWAAFSRCSSLLLSLKGFCLTNEGGMLLYSHRCTYIGVDTHRRKNDFTQKSASTFGVLDIKGSSACARETLKYPLIGFLNGRVQFYPERKGFWKFSPRHFDGCRVVYRENFSVCPFAGSNFSCMAGIWEQSIASSLQKPSSNI